MPGGRGKGEPNTARTILAFAACRMQRSVDMRNEWKVIYPFEKK